MRLQKWVRAGNGRTVIFFIILAVIGLVLFGLNPLVVTYERTALALFPSAERAFHYGSRHLDYAHPALYSITDAEYFYRKAAALDPTYPYVHHQLARISFLRGNFLLALVDINKEIEMYGDQEPNAYYIRGLINGYRGDYTAAAEDYERFLEAHPNNWAALNDYAWVLLKAGKHAKARDAALRGLEYFPENAWLLNSLSIALYELGAYEGAYDAAKKAASSVALVSEQEWSTAYPGNDPGIAGAGLATFRDAVEKNMHMIEDRKASRVIESK